MTPNEDLPGAMPRRLDGNLLLRWGRAEDADALADFNVRIHSNDPQNPELWLGEWTRNMLQGRHPTVTPSEFTVVEDISSGRIVSSIVLIPQTWSFGGILLGVGRPELVGTDEAYRRRGLVRLQMEVIHALSEQKGHLLQAITGIPWYYRQFGYEMALDLGGGRELFWSRPGNNNPQDNEAYNVRAATSADIAALDRLYRIHCAHDLVAHERSEAVWRYHLQGARPDSDSALGLHLIGDATGDNIAYVAFRQEGDAFHVTELGVAEGCSWREVSLYLVRELKRRADALHADRKQAITRISFELGQNHPLNEALGRQLEKVRSPYAWYVRVPDLPRFLRHISPVLEERLAASVVAGFGGRLRLNFYRDNLQLTFKDGRLESAEKYEPKHVEDADATFPDLTFLQLLFGHRSLQELNDVRADSFVLGTESEILLESLFPRRPSMIRPLD